MKNRKFIVEGESLPKWSSPISHAVVANNQCFVSGQLAVDKNGNFIPTDNIITEINLAFDNFFAVIQAAGFTKEDIVFVDIALVDIANMPAVNEVFSALFPVMRRPARTVYQVVALPFGGRVKIMGTAVKSDDSIQPM